jgi:AraC-like DNA-binding protein
MGTEVARHDGEYGHWQMVSRDAHPALRGRVTRYCGYVERTRAPLARTEPANATVALIVSLGPSILVDGERFGSFVAGIGQTPSTTEHDGVQHGIQIDLTPVAARMLLGVPMHELAGRVVALEDLPGGERATLSERLAALTSWEARFRLLDRTIAARLEAAAPPPPSVEWAHRRLRATHGAVGIGALAAEIGCSPRHLNARFRDEVGVPPKAIARLLRFERAQELLGRDDGARFGEIAHACGYFDQAHMNRDFRAFAGAAPTDFLARRLPDGGGIAAADPFAFVQDEPGLAA